MTNKRRQAEQIICDRAEEFGFLHVPDGLEWYSDDDIQQLMRLQGYGWNVWAKCWVLGDPNFRTSWRN